MRKTKYKKRADAQEPRTGVITIRVSPEEREALKKAAQAVGLSVAGYLLGLGLGNLVFGNVGQDVDPDQVTF